MKIKYIFSVFIPAGLLLFNTASSAQSAFKKGSLMVSVSEGSTAVSYKTHASETASGETSGTAKHYSHGECTDGVRDPLIIEYGITNKISLGITSGADIYMIDPSKFYGFKTADGSSIKVTASELTFDGSYHFYVNKRLDLLAFGAIGHFSVFFKSKSSSDAEITSYKADGKMARGGIRVRYYFFRHLGVFGQISSYTGQCSPKDLKANTLPANYTTRISGSAIEGGLCYRFIK